VCVSAVVVDTEGSRWSGKQYYYTLAFKKSEKKQKYVGLERGTGIAGEASPHGQDLGQITK